MAGYLASGKLLPDFPARYGGLFGKKNPIQANPNILIYHCLTWQEEMVRKELEKAKRPKRPPPARKTDWEVEYVKAMKVVDDKSWYQGRKLL